MAGILGGMDLVELSRLLENLIRIGTIHSVDHAAARVRVQSGGIITGWLRWIERRAGETTTWDPPTVGEQCLILSPSGEIANGIVFYGVPSNLIDTPSHNADRHVIRFPDGAIFSYDHVTSHLEISGIKTAEIVASESITHDTPLTHITGKCVIDDLLTYNNGLRGYGGGEGNQVTGNFIHGGSGVLSSYGKVLHSHVHTGVQAGGSNTGAPA